MKVGQVVNQPTSQVVNFHRGEPVKNEGFVEEACQKFWFPQPGPEGWYLLRTEEQREEGRMM